MKHVVLTPSSEEFVEDYPKVMRLLAEPKANAAHFLEFEVGKAVRTVGLGAMFSGYGSDEAFGGEVRYVLALLDADRANLRKVADSSLLQNYAPLIKRLWRIPEGRSLPERYWQLMVRSDTSSEDSSWFRLFERAHREEHSDINTLSRIDREISVPPLLESGQLLKYWGIEKLCPFLDRDVQSAAARMFSDLKIRGTETKFVVRYAAKNVIPYYIINRVDKIGFAFPILLSAIGNKSSSGGNALQRVPIGHLEGILIEEDTTAVE